MTRAGRPGRVGWAGRLPAVLRGLLALAALAVLLAGIPAVLLAVGADPRTVRLPSADRVRHLLTSPDDGTLLIAVLRVVGWAGWAGFAVSAVVETVAAVAGWTAPVLRGLAGVQRPAAYLVAAVVAGLAVPAAGTAGPAAGAMSATAALPDPSPGPSASGDTQPSSATVSGSAPSDTTRPVGAAGGLGAVGQHSGPPAEAAVGGRPGRPLTAIQVRRYDSLWRIAERHLGDGRRWPEVYRLNTGRRQPDGQALTDPDHIEEGWTLLLPADATATGRGGVVVEVRPGDTLSGLAERHLGASTATDALFRANLGRVQPDGRQLTDPDRIYPGWQLLLPQPSTPQPTRSAPPRQRSGTPPSPAQPGTASTGTPAPPSRTAPPLTATPPPSSTGSATTPDPAESTVSTPVPGTPTPAPSSRPGPDRDQPRADGPSRPGRPQPPGVSLPGGWVDVGLAVAVGAAASLVWGRRRRGYTPRPPSPTLRLDEASMAPLPPVVAQLRRGLRRLTEGPLADAEHADEPSGPDGAPGGTSQSVPAGALRFGPGLGGPVAGRWPPAGLGLTGPGAEAAARGLLVTALAAGGTDDPHARGQVVVPADTLATLLGAAAVSVPATPRLTVTAGLADALEVLEAQTLHRTRIVYEHEVDTVAAVRQVDPTEEPLPPVVLLANAAADHERARIAALLAQGQRLDIHGVLLGGWPDGDTILVAEDGTTAEPDTARHGAHPADTGRLTVLTAGQAVDLLATLAESHRGPPPTGPPAGAPPPRSAPPGDPGPPPSVPSAHTRTAGAAASTADTPRPARTDEAAEVGAEHRAEATPANDQAAAATPGDSLPGPADADPAVTVATGGDHPAPAAGPGAVETIPADHADTDLHTGTSAQPGEDAGDSVGLPTAAAGGRRARVLVLGSPRVDDSAAEPGEPLRAKSLELLVYLAVQDDAAARVETILEDLLPDAPARKAPYRLHTYVYSLRRTLARCAGPGTYLTHPAGRYALNRDTLEVDLWQLQTALADADAAAAADPAARLAALRRAVSLYRGPLADRCDYEWAEPYREAIRQQALDAHLALADALAQTGQPADALPVLQAAIKHDPYAEPVYAQAMRIHAALGQPDAIRALRRELTRTLEDIDSEPSPQTTALADQLTTDLERRTRRPPTTAR